MEKTQSSGHSRPSAQCPVQAQWQGKKQEREGEGGGGGDLQGRATVKERERGIIGCEIIKLGLGFTHLGSFGGRKGSCLCKINT